MSNSTRHKKPRCGIRRSVGGDSPARVRPAHATVYQVETVAPSFGGGRLLVQEARDVRDPLRLTRHER